MSSTIVVNSISLVTALFVAAYLSGMKLFQTCEEIDHDERTTQ